MISSMTPDEVVEKFQERLVEQDYAKFVTVELSAGLTGDPVSLDLIFVQSDQRKHRYGDAALRLLIDLCDEAGMDIVLTASPRDTSTDRVKLEGWYMSHGFVHVTGESSLMRRSFKGKADAGT
jgi:hypothetical protein